MVTSPPVSIDDLLDLGSRIAEKLFGQYGVVTPQFAAVTAGGEIMFIPFPPVDKQTGVNLIRELFLEKDVVAYVFLDECWHASGKTREEATRILPSKRPDRDEAVMISVESEREGSRFVFRKIIRPKDGKPFLDAPIWRDFKSAEGLFVGLLAQRTKLQ